MPHYRFGRRIRVRKCEFDAWFFDKFRVSGAKKYLDSVFDEVSRKVQR